ncbi:MAG: CPBP family intramembrane metalloprotease [Promethearchaeota archaeon]|nr:MAG: CPBP family intramembrane metalloprotease [Candidatus Lokiarchaeota archaeon]
MVQFERKRKKLIALKRIRFFYQEVFWGFIIVFLLLLLPLFLLPVFVGEGTLLYGILFYVLRAILVFIGIPLLFPLSNILFESQKRNVILEEDVSPAFGHLKLYKMSKKNYKYQILYGFLIFFLVFLPIDFFPYLFIPETVAYQGLVIGLVNTNYYLSPYVGYFVFLISAIIIQISVSITEETITRAFIAKRGSENFFPMSAVIISSIYFGFGHLAYLFDLVAWYPVMWFFQAFIIGIILSLVVVRKKWILPAIIAHALNNIVAAHTIWNFWQGNSFYVVAFFVYIPLFIIGILFTIVCLLLVWPLSSVKRGISNGFAFFKTYFKRDSEEITVGDTVFRIIFDFLIALIIFLMGFIVMI